MVLSIWDSLVILYLIYLGVYALSYFGRVGLIVAIMLNMSVIAMQSTRGMVSVFGYQTNWGVMFYSGVFLAMALLVQTYKYKLAIRTMTLCAVLSVILSLLNGYLFHDEIASRITIASLLAFFLSNYTFLYLFHPSLSDYTAWGFFKKKGIAVTFGQIVDSVVFFPLAFAGTGVPVMEAMLLGVVLKIFYNLLDFPVFWLRLNGLLDSKIQK